MQLSSEEHWRTRANQHGFDVIAKNGRKISVKTTAQKRALLLFLKKHYSLPMTLCYCSTPMVVVKVYYGCIKNAISAARIYDHVGKYELDISKARKLALDTTTQA